MKKPSVSRRRFLTSTLAGAAAVGALPATLKGQQPPAPAKTGRYQDYLVYNDPKETLEDATGEDIEGPFYRPGAPFRSTLFEKGARGEILVVSGKVVARNGRALAGVVLDIWQCNADGRYDNDDSEHPPRKDQFVMRGKVKTDEKGEYEFTTIKPVAYRIGPQDKDFRPAHIHLKAGAEGYQALTTQIYFKGDKFNANDPWYKKSREIDPKADEKKVLRATFKVVLARA
ncbi:MAG TPA: hypothetical protein VGZ47_21390 [Gemmataceae bacterium]|jgi:protocatechuate 3,4-dioxygenase beta subunit|nr:hypothetical protein [Gemmataceae bacterium]